MAKALLLLAVMSNGFTIRSLGAPPPAPPASFSGGLLGVRAEVDLNLATEIASIRLSGLPLGGTLQGTARFSEGEGSDVDVDEPLKSQLSRRMVSIVDAHFDRQRDIVSVTVRLPFLLGQHELELERVGV